MQETRRLHALSLLQQHCQQLARVASSLASATSCPKIHESFQSPSSYSNPQSMVIFCQFCICCCFQRFQFSVYTYFTMIAANNHWEMVIIVFQFPTNCWLRLHKKSWVPDALIYVILSASIQSHRYFMHFVILNHKCFPTLKFCHLPWLLPSLLHQSPVSIPGLPAPQLMYSSGNCKSQTTSTSQTSWLSSKAR